MANAFFEKLLSRRRPLGATLDSLAEKHYAGEGCRKPISYLAEYERFLEPLRHKPIRLLELGVRFGASMLMWRDYLPRATVVGVDIDKKPDFFPHDSRFHFVAGSQADEAILAKTMEISGGQFDVIIDDCSHVGHLSARSFAYLFPHALRPGGLYIIEDICTAFLAPDFPDATTFQGPAIGPSQGIKDFPSHQNGMIGLVKQIIDHTMSGMMNGASDYHIGQVRILPNVAFITKAN
jgi:cephalosporin hydroxylase